jgi:transcriptional regulator with XRE-family HTH domain
MYGSLATKLRVLRAERGLTVRQVAELSGVAKETISQVERGERHPYDRTLAKLAHAYDVPVDELLEEPALAGKAKAPDTGQPQPSTGTVEEFEQKLERVLAPARAEALRDEQAVNRFFASEGIERDYSGPIAEAEVWERFLDEFSPEERAKAFGEVVDRYALLERFNINNINAQGFIRDLEASLSEAQGFIRGIAELEEEIARLRQENAQLRAEAERRGVRD